MENGLLQLYIAAFQRSVVVPLVAGFFVGSRASAGVDTLRPSECGADTYLETTGTLDPSTRKLMDAGPCLSTMDRILHDVVELSKALQSPWRWLSALISKPKNPKPKALQHAAAAFAAGLSTGTSEEACSCFACAAGLKM